MGCPDWPKCFGLLAPPTCDCQLPPNYMQVFLEKRIQKVNRFANALEKLGWAEKAAEIRNNKAIYQPEAFNATKAWIEYINRLFGVLAGLFSLFFWFFSFRYISSARKVFIYATLGFIALLLNAWLGSVVVATNLLPGIVSVHFMLSFLSIFFFMAAMHINDAFVFARGEVKQNRHWSLLFVFSLVIVFLGTLARENVEVLALSGALEKEGILNWSEMGLSFAFHRYLPVLFMVYAFWLWRTHKKTTPDQARIFGFIGCVAFCQIAFGAININFVLPPVTQVVHIVLGALLPILLFYWRIAKPIGVY
jgi:cytochrome c oxidase assembly protein subunit 15